MPEYTGNLGKMKTNLAAVVEYQLPLGAFHVAMNSLIGSKVELRYNGLIHCVACERVTKKSFNQGYCYPCFKRLAQCDTCIVRPELCHYDAGTCREPEWGETHCLIPHVVYLANSSGLKVGITRHSQVPTRWMDQGAAQALPIFRVQSRLQSGLVETLFKQHVADRTDWRALLKTDATPLDMQQERTRLFSLAQEALTALQAKLPENSIVAVDEATTEMRYPVRRYPNKVTSLDFEKTPLISGVLEGIKGQYLMFDCGVINMRKFGGYQVSLSH